MKKLFVGLIGLALLFATSANAGMNIKQNGDGSTDWQDSSGNNFNVGAVYLTIHMEDVSTAKTAYGVSPITNGRITSIQGTIWGKLNAASAIMDIYTALTHNPPLLLTDEVTDASPTSAGMTFTTVMKTGHALEFTPTSNNSVGKGSIIMIHTDGGSTNNVDVTFTIIIEPNGT